MENEYNNITNKSLCQEGNALLDHNDKSHIPPATTVDYIYYVEWRQFSTARGTASSRDQEDDKYARATMEMTHSRALVGDFHNVINELQTYHAGVSATSAAVAKRGKQKKRVRFQADDKLHTCIPDIIRGCDIEKIDKHSPAKESASGASRNQQSDGGKSHIQVQVVSESPDQLHIKRDEGEVSSDMTGDRPLLMPRKNSNFIRLIKKTVVENKLGRLLAGRCRRQTSEDDIAEKEEAIKTAKTQKTMERSNSYCRHDDSDNVILIGDCDQIQNAEYAYV